MNADSDKKVNRRNALAGLARWGVLGVVGAVTGVFLKRKPTVENEQACVDTARRLGCRQCGQLDRCGLPRALSVKQFLKKHNEERES